MIGLSVKQWRFGVKPVVFLASLLPAAWLALHWWFAYDGQDHGLGFNPFEFTNRYTGDWAIRFLLGCLSLTPLGLLFGWILCEVINPRAFGWSLSLRLHGYAVLEPAVWGLLAAMAAGTIRLGHEPEGALRRVV